MRFLVAILLLTLVFSGYSTAAHAFGAIPCGQESVELAQKSEALCQDAGAQDAHDHQSKSGCTDCHHCCTSSAINVMGGVLVTPLYDGISLSASHDSREGSFISQLRRPPKSLV